MSFWGILPVVIGWAIGAIIMKNKKSWQEVFGSLFQAIALIITCYICWFVL